MDVQRKKIGIVDTTLRDAHQCLWATRMKTAHMLPVAEAMDKAGFAQIDPVAPIQFDVSVRYLKEDPWERVRLMRSKAEHAVALSCPKQEPDDVRHLARRHSGVVGRAGRGEWLSHRRRLRRPE